jgi:broad specificity phosphatase PhoE
MKKVYYVRHGESEANVAGVVAGEEDDSPLTANGKAQAKKAGHDLKGKNIDLIVCSPLTRTVDTATIIAKELGYDPAKIIKSRLFIERSVGIFSGKPYEEYRTAVMASDDHEGLETRQQIYERVKKGFEWLKKQEGKNVVLVSHGGTGRAVKAIANGLSHEHIYKLEGFGNTEIYEFEL